MIFFGLEYLIGHLIDAPVWARWIVGIVFVSIIILTAMAANDFANEREIERKKYEAYMHECVPKLAAQRCNELWIWK